MSTSNTGFTGDLSFDQKKTQDGSSIFTLAKKNAMSKVAKKDPGSTENVNAAPAPASSGKPNFGPGSSGSRSKAAGADRAVPEIWDRQS